MNRDMDQLFRQLRETEPYLCDNGFSDRVGKKTRLQRVSKLSPLQLPILLIATFLGALLCFYFSPVTAWVNYAIDFLLTGTTLASVAISGVLMAFCTSWLLATEKL